MRELQELVDEALADWYTECQRFDTDDLPSEAGDWSASGIDVRLLKGVVDEMGIKKMSPVQKLTIPGILSGQNVIATAETGSGKTLAFILPVCNVILKELECGDIRPTTLRCLALSPTREIAIQTQKVLQTVTFGLPITSTLICGGLKHNAQEYCLRKGVNFVCACPGRLLDVLAHEGLLAKFKTIRYLVLDEADRMLGLGFADDVEFILRKLQPYMQQMLLFSASLPDHVQKLAKQYMAGGSAMRVGILDGGGICRCENIRETVIPVPSLLKLDLLRYLLLSSTDIACTGVNADLELKVEEPHIQMVKGGQCIIFTRTKARANRVCEQLRLHGFLVERIHGNRSQTARVKALAQFVSGESHILVATDVAARGIDLYEVPLVINFDMPATGEEYTHRAGRTGRAGREGQCWSFITSPAELELVEIGLGRDLSSNVLNKLNGFDENREPSYIITESGHQHEVFPFPAKPQQSQPRGEARTMSHTRTSTTFTRHRRRASSGSNSRRRSFNSSTPTWKPGSACDTPNTQASTPPTGRRRMMVNNLLQMECGTIISNKVVTKRGDQVFIGRN